MALMCTACHSENRRDARFCEECGAPFAVTCPACGGAVAQGKRFCGDCGQPLGSGAAIGPDGRDDPDAARPATVVGLRPVSGILEIDVHEWLMSQVGDLEGRLVTGTGDVHLVLFGVPVTLEDHHRRGTVLALRARDRQDDAGASAAFAVGVGGGRLGMREVASPGESEVLRAVSAIAGLADPGQVLVDSATARLLHGAVRLDPVEIDAVAARALGTAGGDHLPLRSAIGDLDARRVVRHRDGRPLSRFVGRAHEMALLAGALNEAAHGSGQIVGIVGEAGMGKTRLVEELRQSTGDAVRWVEGRCVPYGGARPYLPILDVIHDLIGTTPSDEPQNVRRKVARHTRALGLEDDTVDLILNLFDIRREGSKVEGLSPQAVADQTFDALRRLVLAVTRQEQLVIAIEDVHWADETSTNFLTSLAAAAAGHSLLMITTFRPGSRPAWLELSHATQIALSRLGPADALHIVQAAGDRENMSEALGRAILSKADGNPFFLEELALATTETSDLSASAVPETVEGVLLARVDRLPEVTRRVLQTAAVLGRSFPSRMLETVWAGPGSPRHHLGLLCREEFLVEAIIDGLPGFEFKHALTQDVAYQSLPATRRQALHEAAGLSLEALYAGRVDEAYGLLAHHWSHTDDAVRAVGYLRRAAEASARRYAHHEASVTLREALTHADRLAGEDRASQLTAITLRLVQSLYFIGLMAESAAELETIAPVVDEMSDRRLVGEYRFWVAHTASHLGDHPLAARAAGAAVTEARSIGDTVTAGRGLYILCREGWWTGSFREGIAQGEAAVPLLEDAGDYWWLGHCKFFIAHSFYSLGDFPAALRLAARGGAIGDAVADPRLRSWAAWAQGLYEAARGNTEIGVIACERGVQLSPDTTNTAWALGALGFARREAGALNEAIEDLVTAIELAERTHHPGILARFQGWLAEAYLRAGELDRAERFAQEAHSQAVRTDCKWVMGLTRRTEGRVLMRRGDLIAARRTLGDARDRLAAVECRFDLALVHMDIARLDARSGGNPQASLDAARAALAELDVPNYAKRLQTLTVELGLAEPDATAAADRLTPRERQVLALLAEGLSNKRIAGRLVISQGTVIRHVANIFAKLGVNNRTAAARAAMDIRLP